MPTIVIRDHCDRCVANLRLACQLGLRQISHANHVEAKLPVCMRFRQGGKLRPFHANVCSGAMSFHTGRIASFSDVRGQDGASRLVESHVSYDSTAKKRCDTQACAIEELVGDYEIERRQIVAKRTDCADGQNSFHSKHLQRAYIRAIIYLAWR